MVSKSIIICFVIYFVFPDETPKLRLNNVLAEYISANTLLRKENIQLKKTVHNLEQEVGHLKFKEEQMDPVSIKEEPTSGKGLKQFLCWYKGEDVVCRLSVSLIAGNQS